MTEMGVRNGAFGADKFGFKNLAGVHWNLAEAALYEHALRRREAVLTAGGALSADTGVHTGRSPKDKFVVLDPMTENTVWWDANGKLTQENFKLLFDIPEIGRIHYVAKTFEVSIFRHGQHGHVTDFDNGVCVAS